MRSKILLIVVLMFTSFIQAEPMEVKNLKCEYKINPLGIDIEMPRFSWELESNKRGAKQTAYQIIV